MTTSPLRPVSVQERAAGLDLTRGLMLLFIALANSHYFLRGGSVLGGYPRDGSRLDSIAIWLVSTFVDGRAFPLFGLLFGYGVARIASRAATLEPRAVRRLLWRRASVIVIVGFLHAVLLYAGDILTAYGVLLLLGAWLVRWPDRRLLLLAAAFFVLNALPGDSSTLSTEVADVSMLPPDLSTMVVRRMQVSLFIATLGPLGFLCPFAVGLWAGRRRVLELPDRYRGLLRISALVGIGGAVLGAQPVALTLAGVLDGPGRPDLIGPLHDATGVLGGFGYAAALALARIPMSGWRRRLIGAIVATGQRSMTCYVAQSVVWAAAFTPFLLDLSDALSVSGTVLLAAATWAATVLLADRMQRSGCRGPLEALVRRITYGERATGRAGPRERRGRDAGAAR